jgi:hypothetical protein
MKTLANQWQKNLGSEYSFLEKRRKPAGMNDVITLAKTVFHLNNKKKKHSKLMVQSHWLRAAFAQTPKINK